MTLFQRSILRFLLILVLLALGIIFAWYFFSPPKEDGKSTFYTSLSQPKTLDPVFASDYSSCVTTMAFFDTLFQYDYVARPYTIKPSMLALMPTIDSDGLHWLFTLRDDLYFRPDSCFENDTSRRVCARDVCFSILRMADPRLIAPSYFLIRDKIVGLDSFRDLCEKSDENDFTVYEKCSGLKIHSDTQFSLFLTQKDPRLSCYFSMPYTAIVSKKAAQFYGKAWVEKVIGSGPFFLTNYQRDYRMQLDYNPEYRTEFFKGVKIPCSERIICFLVQDLQPAWLMFLNGDLDVSAVSKDQLSVLGSGHTLPSALLKRNIQLLSAPEMQTNYVGISFSDPLLGSNVHLRRAISMAYDRNLRITYYNGLIKLATGPIPPMLSGALDSPSIYGEYNIEKAKKLMILAGFPNGIDSRTQKPLVLTFDLPETGVVARQMAEMMVRDMAKIGIEIRPMLNSKTKFIERNRTGKMQLFRFNWIGDYPDAENFFQLFYSKNAGSSNRAYYNNETFDKMYEAAVLMSDGAQRTALYQKMSSFLAEDVPWIYESHPLSFCLVHHWLGHYVLHDFGFDRWKYLCVDPLQRIHSKASFTPLKTGDLQHENNQ